MIPEKTKLKEIVNRSLSNLSTELALSGKAETKRVDIIIHLGAQQVRHVRNLETARTIWDYLKQLHQLFE